MKIKKHIRWFLVSTSLIFILLLLRVCFWMPWEAERYINYETQYIGSYLKILSSNKFNKYKVNGAFVSIFLRAHNESINSGKGPYKIIISTWGKCKIHEVLYINNFDIISNKNKKHKLIDKKMLPFKLSFECLEDKRVALASFILHKLIDLDFRNGEEIEIIIDMEVHSKNDIQSKKIVYKFSPVLEKGHTSIISNM